MTVSYIIPSINRKTLHRTIDSIEMRPGDEICLEFDLPPTGKWGNPQRNKAIARATTDYLAFIDDDDYYVPGYREAFEKAMTENPGKPNIFRVQYPNGLVLWDIKALEPGHVTGISLLVPNDKSKLHYWERGRNMADFLFMRYWKWQPEDIVWQEEIIALTGHNDGERGGSNETT